MCRAQPPAVDCVDLATLASSAPTYFGFFDLTELLNSVKQPNCRRSGLYAGFFGGGGSIARNPFLRQLYAPPEAAPKFWELLTWKLSWVEDYRQYNTTSEA